LKEAARKSGMFIVSDSDLNFNQPVVRVNIDRSKASDLGINMQQVGTTLATLLGGNYVNRFNLEGRSYQVIPQVPREKRLQPGSLAGYYVPTNTGNLVPLSTIVSIETGTDPNSLTHYNQLNSATFSAVPMPGVTVGAAVDFLEGEARRGRRTGRDGEGAARRRHRQRLLLRRHRNQRQRPTEPAAGAAVPRQ